MYTKLQGPCWLARHFHWDDGEIDWTNGQSATLSRAIPASGKHIALRIECGYRVEMSRWINHELYAHVPECHGYLPLSLSFAQFVAVKCDTDPFDQEQLASNLLESSCEQEVMRWFVRLLQSGVLRSVSRPIGGGAVANVSGTHWHADNVARRFITSQYCRADPFASAAESDSWLFVDESDHVRLWEEHKAEALGQTINPRKAPSRVRQRSHPSTLSSDSALIGLAALEDAVGLRRSTIYKMIKEKRFPSQVKVGNRSLWKRSEIAQWVDQVGRDAEDVTS